MHSETYMIHMIVDIHVLLQKHKQEHNGTDQNDPE